MKKEVKRCPNQYIIALGVFYDGLKRYGDGYDSETMLRQASGYLGYLGYQVYSFLV